MSSVFKIVTRHRKTLYQATVVSLRSKLIIPSDHRKGYYRRIGECLEGFDPGSRPAVKNLLLRRFLPNEVLRASRDQIAPD